MISKELLSEILDESYDNTNIVKIYQPSDFNHIAWETNNCAINTHSINIYELAHKCKEWCLNNNFTIKSSITRQGAKCEFYSKEQTNYKTKIINAKTEPEAIFQACEWILKQKENK